MHPLHFQYQNRCMLRQLHLIPAHTSMDKYHFAYRATPQDRMPYFAPQLTHLNSNVTTWIHGFLTEQVPVQRTIVDDKLSKLSSASTGIP